MPISTPDSFKDQIAATKRYDAQNHERQSLRDSVSSLAPGIARFSHLYDRHIADVNNLSDEQARMGAAASSVAAQRYSAPPRNFSGSLSQALAGAKARTGILNRGDEAIRNQQLKDRLEIVRSGIRRRGQSVDALGRAVNIREGVNVAGQAASDFKSASDANLYGSLAGMGARVAQSYFQNRSPSMNDMYDSGTLRSVNVPPPQSLPSLDSQPVTVNA